MSKEVEQAPLEGTIVQPVIDEHVWLHAISVDRLRSGLVDGVFRDPESGKLIFEPMRRPLEDA